MATDPSFTAAIALGAALLGAAETNLQVPVNSSVIVTAGANGTKIEEIVIKATGTTLTVNSATGVVYLFLFDGTTYHLFDSVLIGVINGTATVTPYRFSRSYINLILKTGWSLRASQSIASNASILKVIAFGGEF